ncbi:MAG TPA: M23 family metallopeptidase [Gemmatimonadales bacterium]|nr:M23 family metallopeptidase [Gemmatimonadales bacterium]
MLLAVLTTLAALQSITWEPARPIQGSLIVVSAPAGVFGQLAGEPLHFVDGRAFAAVPLAATDSVELEVLTGHEGVVENNVVWVPVTPRQATGEKVQAAERFTPPPDSALLVRINRERGLSLEAARRAHELPRLWEGPFLRPRPTRVTSPFGAGREVNGVWRSTHSGLDISGRKGDPVRASNRGVVALVGSFFYGGISVYVLHGSGLMTVYFHLSRALVSVGDTVERGQVIGRVGATGRVTGPHLHWGAQYGAIAFDPADLLTLP